MRALRGTGLLIGGSVAKKGFFGWKLIFILWTIIILNFAFPTFGTSVVNTYMAKAMHMNRAKLGLAYSVFSLMAGLPGPLVARSINKLGIRATLVIGSVFSACGAFMMGTFVSTTTQVLIVLGFVVAAGGSMAGTVTPQVAVARWFHRKRALAMSLLLTASGIGGAIAVPILNATIAREGGNWRAAWRLMGTTSLIAAVLSALLVKNSPEEMGQVADGERELEAEAEASGGVASLAGDAGVRASRGGGAFKTREEWTLGEALKAPALWLLVSTYLGFFMGFFIYVAHGIAHLEGLGHSPAEAATSISVIFISSLIGQTTVAALGDRIEPRFISAIAVCVYGAGTLMAIHAVDVRTMYIYAIMMGAGFSAAFTCLMTLQSNYFGPKVYPALLGITTPIGTILGSVGPVTAGIIFDKYKTYAGVFEIVAGICFASAILYLLAKPPVLKRAARPVGAAIEPT